MSNVKQHDGTFIGFSEEAISLRVGNDEIGVRRENVLRVNNREKTHRGRNALIGAAIGGGAGLVIGATVLAPLARNEGGSIGDAVAGLGAVGAGGGAAMGQQYRRATKQSIEGRSDGPGFQEGHGRLLARRRCRCIGKAEE